MNCGAWLTTFDPWPKRTLPPKTRSGNEPWATACSPFRSERAKSRHRLFCSRVCGWLCSGDHSHNLDSSTFRHKERRTNGSACHAGGDCSFGSVGGPPSYHPHFMGPTACRRPCSSWPLASCGIYGRPLGQRVYHHSVSCRPGPVSGAVYVVMLAVFALMPLLMV